MAFTKSDYAHSLWEHDGHKFIIIEDLDKGNRSVTNDITNVIGEIALKEQIDPMNYHIIYKDSSGMWDGYDWKKLDFIPLQCITWEKAIAKLISSLQKASA